MHTSSLRNRSLVANHISKSLWETSVLSDVSVSVNPGDRIGLVGRNGCGKSTLLKILAGRESVDQGTVVRKGLNLGYLSQEAVFDPFSTIRDVLLQSSVSPEQIFEKQLLRVLTRVGLNHVPSTLVSLLSGGELMRLGFARLLLADPEVLFLDEPTNHLDLQGIEWLTRFLSAWKGGYVVISHNRNLLDAATSTTWELTDGGISVFGGNYSFYREQKRLTEEAKKRGVVLLQEKIKSSKHQYAHEQMRAAHSARAAISDRANDHDRFKAGFKKDISERTAGKKKTRIQESLISLKEELVSTRQKIPPSIRPSIVASESSSRRRLIRVKDFTCGYGGRVLVSIPELEIRFGDRIAIFGNNGSGKSTVVKAFMDNPSVTVGGVIERADRTRIEYLDQFYSIINRKKTVWQLIVENSPNLSDIERRNHLARFLFRDTADIQKPAGVLSGGELARLAIALIAIEQIDLLILDEPTNNLDISAIEETETALQEFKGALIVISHDLVFLRNIGIRRAYAILDGKFVFINQEW